MEEFWILIFVSLFASNSLDKAESVKVKLEEMPLKTFDEIFGEGWWDKGEAEDLKTPARTNFGQIEPNSTDQNPPLTESDHSDNTKNGEEQNQISSNENIAEDERKRKIIDKFHAMRNEFKQKGKYSKKEWTQIERKIAKDLKVSRSKIYEWKKEFGLSRRNPKNERKSLVEKFDQRKAELMRAGIKNSYKEINETVAKELGLGVKTIYNWKRKLGQTKSNKYAHSKQMELMQCYYEFKDQNPQIRDKDIAKIMKIGTDTLVRWKRQFKRQQIHPNSGKGQSVDFNAGSNIQEIGNSN